ncbi:hypothetical protein PVK06_045510 [Gossypium arboreum]|uniref:HMA domain-containing protein n=1 Tax=Gossypium arboreum TaxID=29729 RepID=A0ABR0MUU5_GOSAR|nr:hypothetical protein PVK06_045510 [Gossypium arboreum]
MDGFGGHNMPNLIKVIVMSANMGCAQCREKVSKVTSKMTGRNFDGAERVHSGSIVIIIIVLPKQLVAKHGTSWLEQLDTCAAIWQQEPTITSSANLLKANKYQPIEGEAVQRLLIPLPFSFIILVQRKVS